MASLVVSGDTSGAITLSAPSVAGTNTLSLPAQTATLATLTTPSFATTIGVGGATAAASGAGITFPSSQSASSDANTLDDYEEGTFTPIAYGLSSAGTTTYNSQTGSYTKIGNLVTVNFLLNVASMTGTGTLALGGFPFTAASGNNGSAPVMLENLNWDGGSYVQLYMGESRTYAIPYYMQDNGPWGGQQVVNEQFAAIFTLSYRV